MSYDGLEPKHEKIRQEIEASWSAKDKVSRKCYEKPDSIAWKIPVLSVPICILKSLEIEENYVKETKS